MVYVCPRCQHCTDNKQNHILHLRRKIPCSPIDCDTPTDVILQQFIAAKNAPKPHACNACQKTFAHASGLYRHNKKAHPSHPRAHNASTNNITNNVTNNFTTINDNSTHNITNNYNIVLNGYKNETTDHIDDEYLEKCFRAGVGNGIAMLFNKIYLNDEVPENKNIRLKRQHHPTTVEVFEKPKHGTPAWISKIAEPEFASIIRDITLMMNIYNNHNKDKETVDFRFDALQNVSLRKKGWYAPVKHNIINDLANAKIKS